MKESFQYPSLADPKLGCLLLLLKLLLIPAVTRVTRSPELFYGELIAPNVFGFKALVLGLEDMQDVTV